MWTPSGAANVEALQCFLFAALTRLLRNGFVSGPLEALDVSIAPNDNVHVADFDAGICHAGDEAVGNEFLDRRWTST